MGTGYEEAAKKYAAINVNADEALRKLMEVPVSVHCWQGDDVRGFDHEGPLSGGIQTTGSYPGRAGNPDELMQDLDKAMSLMPGKKKLNLHASYAIFPEGCCCDRDELLPEHFERWAGFAAERGMGIDFNPTFFSHDKVKDGLTLTSSDKDIRDFWIRHGKACIRISRYLADRTGEPCIMNIWIPDGYKDIPGDRMGPRLRYKDALEQILGELHEDDPVKVCVESKVFGIGYESYTAGSSEFTLLFAANHKGVIPLMDNGHYHPTETVSDKISSLLCYFDEIALHITRPVRWDSDHVVLFDDETKEIAKEVVRNNGLSRVNMALDFFDASINRIAAWAVGFRSFKKALLNALLIPHEEERKLQDENRMTELMIMQEKLKTYPLGEIWEEYLRRCNVVSDDDLVKEIRRYEDEVLLKRV